MSGVTSYETSHTYEADLALARSLAEEAGALICARWDTELRVDHKGVVDLVSEVDMAAESLILPLVRIGAGQRNE